MLGTLLASLALAAAPSDACRPLAGANLLLQDPKTRIIWVGEHHGTQEQPPLFGDLACHAAATGRPIIVALERDESEQPAWDAFMQSDGGETARAALLATPSWTFKYQDGRSSVAMLRLVEDLRAARAAGRAIEVKAFLTEAGPEDSQEDRERGMAESLQRISQAHPGALILVLSGNLHASKGVNPWAKPPYRLGASFLPVDETRSVLIRSGDGEAWNCQRDTCGPHPQRSTVEHAREIVLGSDSPGYDAEAFTGAPSTASPPAALPPTPVPLGPLSGG